MKNLIKVYDFHQNFAANPKIYEICQVVQFDDDMISVGSSSTVSEVWAPPVPRSTLNRLTKK